MGLTAHHFIKRACHQGQLQTGNAIVVKITSEALELRGDRPSIGLIDLLSHQAPSLRPSVLRVTTANLT